MLAHPPKLKKIIKENKDYTPWIGMNQKEKRKKNIISWEMKGKLTMTCGDYDYDKMVNSCCRCIIYV